MNVNHPNFTTLEEQWQDILRGVLCLSFRKFGATTSPASQWLKPQADTPSAFKTHSLYR